MDKISTKFVCHFRLFINDNLKCKSSTNRKDSPTGNSQQKNSRKSNIQRKKIFYDEESLWGDITLDSLALWLSVICFRSE